MKFLLLTSLPVADPSFVVEDVGSSFSKIDLSEVFTSVFLWLINAFNKIIALYDSIIIFDNTTLLDFHIAVSVFGILFAVLIVSIRSSVGNSISSVDRSRRSKKGDSD